jgi:hypothetical protein
VAFSSAWVNSSRAALAFFTAPLKPPSMLFWTSSWLPIRFFCDWSIVSVMCPRSFSNFRARSPRLSVRDAISGVLVEVGRAHTVLHSNSPVAGVAQLRVGLVLRQCARAHGSGQGLPL